MCLTVTRTWWAAGPGSQAGDASTKVSSEEQNKEVTENGMLCKENYIFIALHNEIISFNKCMALTHERIEN